ncbi:CHL4-domain-containing protein [Coniochaeta ligniaria NRRL 30616]|uniref:CHL4-domain-containing protein n=1 Tax=Coniochaeta ligniaria NRRL 30616 TaxID=1408157 RepID=A0A1J7IJ95_9PEZI|nr:CHL4-domain-containing protein [Coniochaeta ligniaria NRRL 30616]
MAPISIPTSSRLPSSLRLEATNPIVSKTLSRLSRPSLISIVLDWLDENNQALSAPYLVDTDEEDYPEDGLYPPASSVGELREIYSDLQARKGSKREVVDRIIEGDWRDGLSLYQLAMVDLQYLYDHPTSQKWSAYRIVPLRTPSSSTEAEAHPKVNKESLTVPRFHPSTFLQQLQAQVLPDVKAHYNFDRHKSLPILILRIFILDSPYNTDLAATRHGGDRISANSDSSRTVYIAFPDASPHIFISKSQTVGPAASGESKSLRSLIVEGIPKALSRPRERYTLKSTSLSTRNLTELIHRRGSGRTNAAGGGWSVYADPKKKVSPLNTVLPTPPASEGDDGVGTGAKEVEFSRKRAVSPATEREERAAKRAKRVAQARFGDTAKVDDGKGVERVDIVIEDPFRMETRRETAPDHGNLTFPRSSDGEGSDGERDRPRESRAGRRSNVQEILNQERDEDDIDQEVEVPEGRWRPNVRLTFHGTHVFAGIRQLVEQGVIDGERMPGWMTGEEGVTIGAVRHGRIRGHKGSGI